MTHVTDSQFSQLETQLADLLKEGERLQRALDLAVSGRPRRVHSGVGAMDSLPDFWDDYEPWYSEALRVVATVLPDRRDDFVSLYKIKSGWAISDLLTNPDLLDHEEVANKFRNQRAILASAGRCFRSHLSDLQGVLQAGLFDSELDAARSLCANGFYRGAGAMAGVVLEGHLASVCAQHQVSIRGKGTISSLNEALKKAGVLDLVQWRHVSLLGDLRNKCDHKKSEDPTRADVTQLANGVAKIIKTVF